MPLSIPRSPLFVRSPTLLILKSISPLQLQLAYDAADIATLWQDAEKTTPVGNLDVVGNWEDLGSVGRDATQSTAGNKPIYHADVLGTGYPGIKFDGSDDFLTWSDFSSNAITVYLVATGVDDDSDAHCPLDLQNDGDDPYRHILQFHHLANDYQVVIRPNATGVVGTSDPVGRHLIILQATDGGNATLYFDSADSADGGPTAMPSGWANDNAVASRMGLDTTGASPFNGYIHSLLIYNLEHTLAQRTPIAAYLASRYGITLS